MICKGPFYLGVLLFTGNTAVCPAFLSDFIILERKLSGKAYSND